MTTELPRPLNNFCCSVLKLQTKEMLYPWETVAQEPTMASFEPINQTPPCGNIRASIYISPLEVSKLVCHNLPEGAPSQFRQPSSHSASIKFPSIYVSELTLLLPGLCPMPNLVIHMLCIQDLLTGTSSIKLYPTILGYINLPFSFSLENFWNWSHAIIIIRETATAAVLGVLSVLGRWVIS